MSNYTKFLVVRHPFTRLVSSYQDKIKNPKANKHIQDNILQNLSPNQQNKHAPYPYFQDFIEKVLDKDWKHYKDRNWQTFDSICQPCHVKYDYVLKLESIESELLPILTKLSSRTKPMHHLIAMIAPKKKSRTPKIIKDSRLRGRSVVAEYFNVTREQRIALKDMFKVDLDLFGYDFWIDSSEVVADVDCDSGLGKLEKLWVVREMVDTFKWSYKLFFVVEVKL